MKIHGIKYLKENESFFGGFGVGKGILSAVCDDEDIEIFAASHSFKKMLENGDLNHLKHLNQGCMVVLKNGTYQVYEKKTIDNIMEEELRYNEAS